MIVEILVCLIFPIILNIRANKAASLKGWEHVNITFQRFLNLCDNVMSKLRFRGIK